MKKKPWMAATALLALAGAAIGAQSAQPTQDLRKVRQELETMKAILQTTMRYALETDRPARGSVVFEQNIDSYYLPGQGAVFIVPVNVGGDMPGVPLDELQNYLEAAEGQEISERVLRGLERDMERAMLDAQAAVAEAHRGLVWTVEGEAPEAPEPPPAPETPPAVGAPPPPPPPVYGGEAAPAPEQAPRDRRRAAPAENSRERLEQLRTRLEQQKQDLEKRRQDAEAAFARVREGLMDSLSKHGDSLSILRPEDTITLILKRESGWGHFRGPLLGGSADPDESRATVLSVRKSDVSDYKAGRLDRGQFLKRVLEYRQ